MTAEHPKEIRPGQVWRNRKSGRLVRVAHRHGPGWVIRSKRIKKAPHVCIDWTALRSRYEIA